jgi:hypothetical protein
MWICILYKHLIPDKLVLAMTIASAVACIVLVLLDIWQLSELLVFMLLSEVLLIFIYNDVMKESTNMVVVYALGLENCELHKNLYKK